MGFKSVGDVGTTTDPHVAERVGRACLLLPALDDELQLAAGLIRSGRGSFTQQPAESRLVRLINALGIYYRRSDF